MLELNCVTNNEGSGNGTNEKPKGVGVDATGSAQKKGGWLGNKELWMLEQNFDCKNGNVGTPKIIAANAAGDFGAARKGMVLEQFC